MSKHNSSSEAARVAGAIRGQRFRSAHRLRTRADFARVYQQGRRARGKHILVVAALSDQPKGARLGLSVGRKYSKSAVLRNHAKRLFREAFRLLGGELPAWDIIIIPLVPSHKFKIQELHDELMTLIPKLDRKLAK